MAKRNMLDKESGTSKEKAVPAIVVMANGIVKRELKYRKFL